MLVPSTSHKRTASSKKLGYEIRADAKLVVSKSDYSTHPQLANRPPF